MAAFLGLLFALCGSVLGQQSEARSLQYSYYNYYYKDYGYYYSYGYSNSYSYSKPSSYSYSSSSYKSSSSSTCDKEGTVETGSSCKYSWEC